MSWSDRWIAEGKDIGMRSEIDNQAAKITQLEAQLEAVQADSAWQPIETAPRDGTHILLANESGTSEGGWLSDIDHGADWEGQIGMAGFWRADGTDWLNTHWKPLPKPPIVGEATEQPLKSGGLANE